MVFLFCLLVLFVFFFYVECGKCRMGRCLEHRARLPEGARSFASGRILHLDRVLVATLGLFLDVGDTCVDRNENRIEKSISRRARPQTHRHTHTHACTTEIQRQARSVSVAAVVVVVVVVVPERTTTHAGQHRKGRAVESDENSSEIQ